MSRHRDAQLDTTFEQILLEGVAMFVVLLLIMYAACRHLLASDSDPLSIQGLPRPNRSRLEPRRNVQPQSRPTSTNWGQLLHSSGENSQPEFTRERSTAVPESRPISIQPCSAFKPGPSSSVDEPESIYGYKVSSLSPSQRTVEGLHSARSTLGPQLPGTPRRKLSYNSASSLLPICELNVLVTPHLCC